MIGHLSCDGCIKAGFPHLETCLEAPHNKYPQPEVKQGFYEPRKVVLVVISPEDVVCAMERNQRVVTTEQAVEFLRVHGDRVVSAILGDQWEEALRAVYMACMVVSEDGELCSYCEHTRAEHEGDVFGECWHGSGNGNRCACRKFVQDEDDERTETSFTNVYVHCGKVWTDSWSCMCNSRCPQCNREIEPFLSVDNDSLEERDFVLHVPGDFVPEGGWPEGISNLTELKEHALDLASEV